MRSGVPKRTDEAFDGKARKSKMSGLPMFWYCPLLDFTGSAAWSVVWIAQLELLGRDHLFPDFRGDSIGDAREWSKAKGPHSKHKVLL